MKDGAPKIHERGNVARHFFKEVGNIEKAFSKSDHVFEDVFFTPAVSPGPLETHGSVVSFDSRGNLTLWSSTQVPHYVRLDLSEILDLPLYKISVMMPSGSGSKSFPSPPKESF